MSDGRGYRRALNDLAISRELRAFVVDDACVVHGVVMDGHWSLKACTREAIALNERMMGLPRNLTITCVACRAWLDGP